MEHFKIQKKQSDNDFQKDSLQLNQFPIKEAEFQSNNLLHKEDIKCQNQKLQKAKAKLKQILQDDGQHDLNDVFNKISNLSTKQKMFEFLSQFAKKKIATQLANDFFIALQKDRIILPKIQQFYQNLRNKGMVGQDIEKIQQYRQAGKKYKIKKFIDKKIGEIESQKLFNEFQSQFVQKESKPLESSIFVKQLNELKIYRYPEVYIVDQQKYNLKTLIVLGETGCGKSTFLNSLVNFLAGVELEDSFRYFIVIQNTQSQLKSITNNISEYYIRDKRNGNYYRVIDTPGFGDTESIDKDDETVKKIRNLFQKQIDEIHLVLFLMKSSNVRVTVYHKYIFQSIMDLFDKSIAQNFVFVITFSDGQTSNVLQHIEDKQAGFGSYWNDIKQPKTIKINNSGFFHKFHPENKIVEDFWQIGTKFMSQLIRKAQSISAKSLKYTKQLIRKRQNLNIRIKNTARKIDNNIINQENIREQLLQIIDKEVDMRKNQKFQIEIEQQQWYEETVQKNVTICKKCMYINCHDDCGYKNGNRIQDCQAMTIEGNCTVCPGKCHYSDHIISHTMRKVRNITKIITNEQLKKKYYDAKYQVNWYENVVSIMMKDCIQSIEETKQSIREMAQLQKQMVQLSMSNEKPLSTRNYLEFLITKEQRQRKLGYLKKIQRLSATILDLDLQEKTCKGQTYNEMNRRTSNLFEQFQKDQRAKSSYIFSKIKNQFFQFLQEEIKSKIVNDSSAGKKNIKPSIVSKK